MILVTFIVQLFFQVLVEKLLRSTPVKKVFLLIRPKKGLDSRERLEELLASKIFDGLVGEVR